MKRFNAILVFWMILNLMFFAGCKDQSVQDSGEVVVSLSIHSPSGYSINGAPLANALGTIDEITQVTVDVKNGAEFLISGQTLSQSGNAYSGVLSGLPLNTSLEFIGHAYNGSAVEIYSNSTAPVSQTLTGDDTVSLFLTPIDDGQSILLPYISRIEHESSVSRGLSLPVRIWVTANDEDETLEFDLSSDAFEFSPATGSLTTFGLNRSLISTATATTSVGAGAYDITVKITNEQGNYIETPFSIDISNPYLLPDSGHTTDTTTTWGEDADYLINALSYTDNGDGTVTDNITGLTWQQSDDDQTRGQALAVDYCSTLSLGGYDDWRLPSVMELKDILDYDGDPAIDTTVFLGSANVNYWTSTLHPNNTANAFYINFGTATQSSKAISSSYYARCVRGMEVIYSNLQDNGDGTISDLDTNLTWQQSEGGTQTWESAITYCEALSLGGNTDWRLPDAKELMSLYNYSITGSGVPKIDATLFPNAIADNYWTSTTYGTTTKGWHIDFDTADFGVTRKTSSTINSRCVRSTQ